MSSSSASPPDSALLHSILATVVDASKQAGVLIASNRGRTAVKASKASYADLVTLVDSQCQDVIASHMSLSWPQHVMLGEESTAPGAAASSAAVEAMAACDWLWICDPLDGTTNFVHGLPLSTVSVAVAHKGEVVIGVVHDPYHNETFTAVRGEGAFLNGARMHVSCEEDLKACLFGYGLHSTHRVAEVMLKGLDAVVHASRGARSLGSAALQLAYVAAGRYNGFWELDLASWDVSAGALLVQEAGGRVTDTRGVPFSIRTRDILATTGAGKVHDDVLALLRGANAHQLPPLPETTA